ncbi:MAG: hypothetical protein FWF52_04220 [Candidatus Azobacteroides sp.]|nr:hypothetical protein [Candidatus Azobacteroides sp.]
MATKKIKISELPLETSFTGLFTIGVNEQNESVKVGLEFVKTAADAANEAASHADANADQAKQAADAAIASAVNANTKAGKADQAAAAANAAANQADAKAKIAEQAAGNANAAAGNIQSKIDLPPEDNHLYVGWNGQWVSIGRFVDSSLMSYSNDYSDDYAVSGEESDFLPATIEFIE